MTVPPQKDTIDAIMQHYFLPEVPGAAILVIENGKMIISQGYGLADLEKHLPITPATNFRMASVSKQFTAMSIMVLRARGNVKLQDQLNTYLPYLPPAIQSITLHQLLTHTSGIPDYEPLIPGNRTEQLTDEDVLELLGKENGVYFKPGSRFRYSNTGYCLLSLIVEKAGGKTFPAFVRDNIFEPLRMAHSRVYDKKIKLSDRALGYHHDGKRWQWADQDMTSATLGDGGVYTSLNDYRRWHEALDNELLLPPEDMVHIFTEYAVVRNGVGYGYGWFVAEEKDGTKCLFHSGESTGFRHIVYRNPDKKILMAIFSNRDDDVMAEVFDLVASTMHVQTTFIGENTSLVHWLNSVYEDEHFTG